MADNSLSNSTRDPLFGDKKPLEVIVDALSEPEEILIEMVRRGRTLKDSKGTSNLITEIIYRATDSDREQEFEFKKKGKRIVSHGYNHNFIFLNGNSCDTRKLFENKFQGHTYLDTVSFLDLTPVETGPRLINLEHMIANTKKELVETVLGKGTYQAFNYAHSKHLETGGTRKVGENYFEHPLQVALYVKEVAERFGMEQGFVTAVVNLALLHDVIEEQTDFRRDKKARYRDKKSGTQDPEKINMLDNRIERLNSQILSPPELAEADKYAYKNGHDQTEMTAFLLKRISNTKAKPKNPREKIGIYKQYVSEMYNEIEENLGRHKDWIENWDLIDPLVKLADSYHNTEKIIGLDWEKQYLRIAKNHILLDETKDFLARVIREEKDLGRYEMILSTAEQLLSKTVEQLTIIIQPYKTLIENGSLTSDYEKIYRQFQPYENLLEQVAGHFGNINPIYRDALKELKKIEGGK